MDSQDHLQNAIEYPRKYQKESVEVGDSEPDADNTYTENHDVDDDSPRSRSEKVSASLKSNMQTCNQWIKTGAIISYQKSSSQSCHEKF